MTKIIGLGLSFNYMEPDVVIYFDRQKRMMDIVSLMFQNAHYSYFHH